MSSIQHSPPLHEARDIESLADDSRLEWTRPDFEQASVALDTDTLFYDARQDLARFAS